MEGGSRKRNRLYEAKWKLLHHYLHIRRKCKHIPQQHAFALPCSKERRDARAILVDEKLQTL